MSPPTFQGSNVNLLLCSCVCGCNICPNLDDVASLSEVTELQKKPFPEISKKPNNNKKSQLEFHYGDVASWADALVMSRVLLLWLQWYETHNPVSMPRAFCYILSRMWNLLFAFCSQPLPSEMSAESGLLQLRGYFPSLYIAFYLG